MISWVNLKNREPRGGNVFCKVNGRKEVLHTEKLKRYIHTYDDVLWLDEFCETQPISKPKNKIENITLQSLENLFGIKAANRIKNKLKIYKKV